MTLGGENADVGEIEISLMVIIRIQRKLLNFESQLKSVHKLQAKIAVNTHSEN